MELEALAPAERAERSKERPDEKGTEIICPPHPAGSGSWSKERPDEKGTEINHLSRLRRLGHGVRNAPMRRGLKPGQKRHCVMVCSDWP